VNNNGLTRPIHDLFCPQGREKELSVNAFVDTQDFCTTWDDFRIVASFLRRKSEPIHLGIFDWAKAYQQIPTTWDQWPYLMKQDFKGNLLLDTRITFGGVAGCGSFERPANAWKHIMLKEFKLVAVFWWVDNNLFITEINKPLQMSSIVKKSVEMGVEKNKEKVVGFQLEQKYIGFIWNGVAKTVQLPETKLMERQKQVQDILVPSTKFTFNQIEIMAGHLNHVLYILPQLRCYLNRLYQMLCNWVNKDTIQPIPEDVKEDMEHWRITLLAFKETCLVPNPKPTKVGWVGNASTG
jgi:hypothetical protein